MNFLKFEIKELQAIYVIAIYIVVLGVMWTSTCIFVYLVYLNIIQRDVNAFSRIFVGDLLT